MPCLSRYGPQIWARTCSSGGDAALRFTRRFGRSSRMLTVTRSSWSSAGGPASRSSTLTFRSPGQLMWGFTLGRSASQRRYASDPSARSAPRVEALLPATVARQASAPQAVAAMPPAAATVAAMVLMISRFTAALCRVSASPAAATTCDRDLGRVPRPQATELSWPVHSRKRPSAVGGLAVGSPLVGEGFHLADHQVDGGPLVVRRVVVAGQ